MNHRSIDQLGQLHVGREPIQQLKNDSSLVDIAPELFFGVDDPAAELNAYLRRQEADGDFIVQRRPGPAKQVVRR